MGVTRERVRQIEAQALTRLRHPPRYDANSATIWEISHEQ